MQNSQTRFSPYVAVALCVLTVVCTSGLATSGLTVLDETLLNEFGWSVGQLKLRDSINFLGAASLIIFVGHAVDRFGYKPSMVFGLGVLSAAYFMYAFIANLTHVYAIHIAIAVSIACAGNTVCVIGAASSMPERRGLAIGLTVAGTSIAGIVMPNLMGWLNQAYGWRATFQYQALIPLILLILIVLFLNNQKAAKAQSEDSSKELGMAFTLAIRTPQFYLLAFASAFAFFTVMAMFSHLFLYARGLGFDVKTAVFTISVFSMGALAGKLLFGWLADRGRRIFLLRINMLTMLIGMAGVFNLPQFIWIFLVVAALGWGGLNTLFNAVVVNMFGLKEAGKILATLSLFQTAGAGLGAAVAGWLFDLRGDYQLAFSVTLGIMALAAICSFALTALEGDESSC